MRAHLETKSLSGLISNDSVGRDPIARIRLLEAKVEYLLDEVYNLKSMLSWHRPRKRDA
jgi:hypothetical protein